MPIYEAGSCFFKLVYGWCMAGVWLVYGWCMAGVFAQAIEARILSFDITFYLWRGIFDLDA